MNITKQKLTHRHREQTGYRGKRGGRKSKMGKGRVSVGKKNSYFEIIVFKIFSKNKSPRID